MKQTSHWSLNCQYYILFYCSKLDGQNAMQYSGYLLCLGNRKRNIFLRLLLAFSKLVCSPVVGAITAVSALRGLVSRQVQDMTTVIHNKKISQDPFLHIQGRAEIIFCFFFSISLMIFNQKPSGSPSQYSNNISSLMSWAPAWRWHINPFLPAACHSHQITGTAISKWHPIKIK